MLTEKVLIRDHNACIRLSAGDGELAQTGIVAVASVADYDSNRIRKHEFTSRQEEDRVRQIEALNAQTGPVLMAYPHAPEIDALLAQASASAPVADVTADTGVRHSLWRIDARSTLDRFTSAFDALPALYIADGHHRSAAASKVAAARRAANPLHAGAESYNHFLAVAVPHHQMRILPYNRMVTDLNGLSRQEFVSRLGRSFAIHAANAALTPAKPGEFGLYLFGQWYRLNIHPQLVSAQDPVERLDVSLLADMCWDLSSVSPIRVATSASPSLAAFAALPS